MKELFKKMSFLIAVTFIIVVIFGYIFLTTQVMVSESKVEDEVPMNLYDIIGYVDIKSINLNRHLMQGLDNTFYLTHNYFQKNSKYGEFYLDYEGDLINNNNPIIYTRKENINYEDLRINDRIKIYYLDNQFCYQITSINKNINKKYDLLLKIYDNDLEINILTKKVDIDICK